MVAVPAMVPVAVAVAIAIAVPALAAARVVAVVRVLDLAVAAARMRVVVTLRRPGRCAGCCLGRPCCRPACGSRRRPGLRSAVLVAAPARAGAGAEPPLFSKAEPGVTGVAWTIGIVGVGWPPAWEFEPTGGAL